MSFVACSAVQASDYCAQARQHPLKVGDKIERLYWSDADSGRANGVCFRMKDLDAPETGGVGMRGGAKCKYERKLGYHAKAHIKDVTSQSDIYVTGESGFDKYNRQVLAMSVNGSDLRSRGIEDGVYKSWVFKNGRALWPKPDYCNSKDVVYR